MNDPVRKMLAWLTRSGAAEGAPVNDVADRVRGSSWELVDQGGENDSGWIYNDHPAWSCTVGRWCSFGLPELLICGLPRRDRRYIIRSANLAMDHGLLEVGTVDHELTSWKLKVVAVDDSWHGTELLRTARDFYDGELPEYRQFIWADDAGRFPGEDGFDEKLNGRQPDLSLPWPNHPDDAWKALT